MLDQQLIVLVPDRIESESFDLAVLVHCANAVAREALARDEEQQEYPPGLDVDMLFSMGMADELPTWRRVAQALVEGAS